MPKYNDLHKKNIDYLNRINVLERKFKPIARSHFQDIVLNILQVLYDFVDSEKEELEVRMDYDIFSNSLELYLALIEENKVFREKEMNSCGGMYPEEDKDVDYAAYAVVRLK